MRPDWVLRLTESWKDRHPAVQALADLPLETMSPAERSQAYLAACEIERASLERETALFRPNR